MRNLTYNDVAICICTYKNRYDRMLKHINTFKPFNVYVVCRRNDFTESGYDKYEWDDNVNVILLDNVNNINETREAARKEIIKLGYKAVIMLDDDINGEICLRIKEENKRTTSNSYRASREPFIDLLKRMVNASNEYDASVVTLGAPIYIGFARPNSVGYNTSLQFCCVVFLNLEDCEKHNIKYETSMTIHEDTDIIFQYLREGLNCITLNDWSYDIIPYKLNSSLIGNETWYKVGLFIKWKNYCPVGIRYKKGYNDYTIVVRPNAKKIFNNKEEYFLDTEYNKKLYEICKKEFYGERNAKNIIDFIKENKGLK